ncbi:hypothetical protein FKW77_000878 [Venturia effusa]|uniref:Uncharacterized protein n=1 Tax=Venturia effusa TaxID=50376 RepID=A0A517L4S3_9PEZI|nr:hypothetical protein FKW77_000878 [Venturia effusa]
MSDSNELNDNFTSTDQAKDSKVLATITSQLPPMMRLPTEMRAKIFKYLLPDKSQNIEPAEIICEYWESMKEEDDMMLTRVIGRAHAQHRSSNDLLGFSQFYGPYNPAVHNTQYRVPFSFDTFAIPLNFSVAAFGGVYGMPSTNASSSSKNGINWSSSPTVASTSSSAKKPPTAGQEEISSFWPGSSEKPQTNIFIDPPTAEGLTQIKQALQEEIWDALPTNTTVNLMTTHSLFATEIATILYEEYTFEIHVHADFIDFLHLPRIATYEYYGNELAEQMAQFQEKGHFCLQRMRHLSFVLVGEDIESRTASWRMRKNVQDLVGMAGQLATLDVRISGDDDFWIVSGEGKEGSRARMGLKDVSIAEMVCAPLVAGLSGVGKVELELPDVLEEVREMTEWKAWFEARIMGRERAEKDGFMELKETAMFEATIEWEYRQQILEGGESFAWLEDMHVDMEEEEEDDEMWDEGDIS